MLKPKPMNKKINQNIKNTNKPQFRPFQTWHARTKCWSFRLDDTWLVEVLSVVGVVGSSWCFPKLAPKVATSSWDASVANRWAEIAMPDQWCCSHCSYHERRCQLNPSIPTASTAASVWCRWSSFEPQAQTGCHHAVVSVALTTKIHNMLKQMGCHSSRSCHMGRKHHCRDCF